ncbi:hypothetical protein GY45DRAFT_1081729 [Cubamyces sp. BRFM 1775]|nr:hypothetical protein GY45DRAFT_1081729 [Cubamyces sp. BRFM 1775]
MADSATTKWVLRCVACGSLAAVALCREGAAEKAHDDCHARSVHRTNLGWLQGLLAHCNFTRARDWNVISGGHYQTYCSSQLRWRSSVQVNSAALLTCCEDRVSRSRLNVITYVPSATQSWQPSCWAIGPGEGRHLADSRPRNLPGPSWGSFSLVLVRGL